MCVPLRAHVRVATEKLIFSNSNDHCLAPKWFWCCWKMCLIIKCLIILCRNNLVTFAHWAECDYGLSTGHHAVLPEGKGNLVTLTSDLLADLLAVQFCLWPWPHWCVCDWLYSCVGVSLTSFVCLWLVVQLRRSVFDLISVSVIGCTAAWECPWPHLCVCDWLCSCVECWVEMTPVRSRLRGKCLTSGIRSTRLGLLRYVWLPTSTTTNTTTTTTTTTNLMAPLVGPGKVSKYLNMCLCFVSQNRPTPFPGWMS